MAKSLSGVEGTREQEERLWNWREEEPIRLPPGQEIIERMVNKALRMALRARRSEAMR
jgi:hypothetical protein